MGSDQEVVVYQRGWETCYRKENSPLEISAPGHRCVTVRMLTHLPTELHDYWDVIFTDEGCECLYGSLDFPQQRHSCKFTALCNIGYQALKAYIKSRCNLQDTTLNMFFKPPEKEVLFFRDKVYTERWFRKE